MVPTTSIRSLGRGAARWVAAVAALVASVAVLTTPVANAQQPNRDIVDTAVAAGQFNTLVQAVQAAGLAETLKGPGPFTVFAPTDAAFNKLPAGTLDSLLQNRDQLRSVLTYHVVQGRVMAADLPSRPTANSVQGAALNFSTSGGAKVNNANIVQADVMATNGVIHAIDTVLLPPGAQPAALPSAGEASIATPTRILGLFGGALLLVGGLLIFGGPALSRARNR